MAWATPSSRAQGFSVTPAVWNQDVVDNPQYLYDNNGILDAKVHYSKLSVAAGTFSVTGIPQTYDHLLIVGYWRSSYSAGSSNALLRFNSDSGSNYATQSVSVGSTTVTGARNDPISSITVAFTGDTGTANLFDVCRIWIGNYRETDGFKPVIVQAGYNGPTLLLMSGYWKSTSAITSLSIADASGNFKAGSALSVTAFQSV